MSKKFKKMQIDDFDSLLDSVTSGIEDTPSKQVKPITEKSLKAKKEEPVQKPFEKVEKVKVENKKEEVVEAAQDQDFPLEDMGIFPGFGEEQNLEVVEEPPVRKEEPKVAPTRPVKKVENKNPVITGKSEFATTHSKSELSEYGKRRLKEICYNEEQEEILFPLVCQDLFGFKGTFIGDKGGLKGEFIENLSVLLYEIGKTNSPKYITLRFSEIPEKFDTDKLYIIEDLNDAVINLFNMDDLSQTSSVTQQSYRTKMEHLIRSSGYAYIVLNAIDTELKGFLTIDARLPFLFGRRVKFENLSNEAIVDRFIDALPEFHRGLVTKQFRNDAIVYLERNRRYFPFDNQELANYLANYTARYEKLVFPKEKYNAKTLEESFKSIVGMAVVKKQINELNEYLQIRQRLEKAGIKLPPFNLHMMFLGNPGVGKTTIARIIAKVLFDLGYIREEKLVEVTSKDLVSAYGNQTGIKTNKVIMNAMGGVLFVDEAYSLAISCGQAGAEAIANLIKAMEDFKGDLVVMFAGYSLEMQEFVRSNSGIASRISYVFEFSDYTAEELYQIFEIKLRNTGMIFGESAKDPVMKLCKFAAGRRNFGNGRFVDKLLQRALTKHATLNLPPTQMLVLIKDSIPEVEEIMASFGRFGA